MQVCIFFLKLGFQWTFPGDCTVGTSLGRTTRGILGGFPGRVLSAWYQSPRFLNSLGLYIDSYSSSVLYTFLTLLLGLILFFDSLEQFSFRMAPRGRRRS